MKPVRIEELDYLKGILITLVVLFHLTYFSTEYTLQSSLFDTFHMSRFLSYFGLVDEHRSAITPLWANDYKDSPTLYRVRIGLYRYLCIENGGGSHSRTQCKHVLISLLCIASWALLVPTYAHYLRCGV